MRVCYAIYAIDALGAIICFHAIFRAAAADAIICAYAMRCLIDTRCRLLRHACQRASAIARYAAPAHDDYAAFACCLPDAMLI